MSDCCSQDPAGKPGSKRCTCPANGQEYLQVPLATVLQHVKTPWKSRVKDQAWYFCDDVDCNTVYFGEDATIIDRPRLRSRVGIKETSDTAPVCYCFDVSRADALANPEVKAFVIEQTKLSNCACETRNPSGRCCLKDFPK